MVRGAAQDATPKAAQTAGHRNAESNSYQAQHIHNASGTPEKAAANTKAPTKGKFSKTGKGKAPAQAAAPSPVNTGHEGTPTPTPTQLFASLKKNRTPRKANSSTKPSTPPKMPTPTKATENITCFGHGPRPKKHVTAVDNLYFRGVWIGFLSPDKIDTPFRGLPSYAQLLRNSENFTAPFPHDVPGIPTDERQVTCRGCAGENPETLSIKEKGFTSGRKLAIIPLEGERKEILFAILIPQPTDRTTPKVQIYRFWETNSDDKGFTNKLGLLAVRNASRAEGTLATILQDIGKPNFTAPTATDETPDAGPSTNGITTRRMSRQSQGQLTTAVPDLPVADTPNKASKRKQSVSHAEIEQAPKRHAGPVDATTTAPTPTPRTSTAPSITPHRTEGGAGSFGQVPVGGQSMLTNEQAGQVTFIWAVQVGDTGYESVHTLAECEGWSWAGLLSLLNEYAAVDDEMLAVVVKAKLWRLSFVEGNGRRKAYLLKSGSEATFERLKEVLAGVLGVAGVGEKVEVEVEAVGV